MVPVNLRSPDEPLPRELGNRFALVLFTLPSGLSTPFARLAETKRRMDAIKVSPEAVMTFGMIRGIGRTGSTVERCLVDFFANKATGVTTNVPGPPGPRYVAGSRITSMLGWAPESGKQTLGTCIFTYDDHVHIGFKVDTDTIAHPEEAGGGLPGRDRSSAGPRERRTREPDMSDPAADSPNGLVHSALGAFVDGARAVADLVATAGSGAVGALPQPVPAALTRMLTSLRQLADQMPPVTAEIDVVVREVHAKRLSIQALQAELAALDEQLEILENSLAPVQAWSKQWNHLRHSLAEMVPQSTI